MQSGPEAPRALLRSVQWDLLTVERRHSALAVAGIQWRCEPRRISQNAKFVMPKALLPGWVTIVNVLQSSISWTAMNLALPAVRVPWAAC